MRVIKYDWPRVVGAKNPAVFYIFGDTHFGNPNVDMDLLKKHIEMCRREKAGWFHLGDWCEFIAPNDRRFSIVNPPPSITEQIEQAIDTFWPIKDQCIAVLSGNHEEVIEKNYGSVMSGRTGIAGQLGVPYLGYSGFVRLRLYNNKRLLEKKRQPQKSYTLFLHHGHGMGALLGAKTINLHRMGHKFDADIYFIGHIHTHLYHMDLRKGIRTWKLRQPTLTSTRRYYASTPSYFDPYIESEKSNYAERKALYPQPMGCLRLQMWYNRQRNEVGGWKEDIQTVKIEAVLE